MRQAKDPFQFVTASYLVHIRRERAHTLAELAKYIRACSEESIFYHTFQSLETHHYTAFSSDFAQWVMAACNEAPLSERMAAIDVRDFVSLQDLRETLAHCIEEYIQRRPASADHPAFEPFHFCEVREVILPLGKRAYNLAELCDGIRGMSLDSLHYHFINSRLRLRLRTNDFSNWIAHSLQLPQLATKVAHIDFYTHSLEGVRQRLLGTINPWRDQ